MLFKIQSESVVKMEVKSTLKQEQEYFNMLTIVEINFRSVYSLQLRSLSLVFSYRSFIIII